LSLLWERKQEGMLLTKYFEKRETPHPTPHMHDTNAEWRASGMDVGGDPAQSAQHKAFSPNSRAGE